MSERACSAEEIGTSEDRISEPPTAVDPVRAATDNAVTFWERYWAKFAQLHLDDPENWY